MQVVDIFYQAILHKKSSLSLVNCISMRNIWYMSVHVGMLLHIHIHTQFRHTHTHTYLFGRSTMDYNRGLGISGILHATVDRVFMAEHGFFFFCVCKINYLTMDYPLPLRKSIIGQFFFYTMYVHAYAICYRMAGLWQSWTSMVGVCPRLHSDFSDGCPWLKVLTNAHTRTRKRLQSGICPFWM